MHNDPIKPASAFGIRRAAVADAAALADLCAEHAAFERAAYDKPGKASGLRKALSGEPPRLYAWVAVAESEMLGYASASPEYSTWLAGEYLHLDCLFVRPGRRDAGIGAALLNAVVEQARTLGLDEVQWQTPHWNLDAARFYRRHGGIDQTKLRFTRRLASGTPAETGDGTPGERRCCT